MKNSVLLPNYYRKIGLILIVISISMLIIDQFGGLSFLENIKVLAIYNSGTPLDQSENAPAFFKVVQDDFRFEVIVTLSIIGLIFFGFSKRKYEDELIQKLRLNALLWATYIHFGLYLFFTLFTFGFFYLNFMLIGIFTIIIIYILRFEFKMYQLNKESNEK
jgi:hypothetical protein